MRHKELSEKIKARNKIRADKHKNIHKDRPKDGKYHWDEEGS